MTESSPPNLGTPKPGTPNVGEPEPPALDTTDDVRDELPHDLESVRFRRPVPVPRQQPSTLAGRDLPRDRRVVRRRLLRVPRFADRERRLAASRPACSPWPRSSRSPPGGGCTSTRPRRSWRRRAPSASRSATPRRNRSGVDCAAARRGACSATPPRTHPCNAGWCSSTRSTAKWCNISSKPNPDIDVLL